MQGEEGAFAICSFWLVSALVEIGEIERAHQLCEKLLSFAGPLGLYAEEIDPHSGRHLGNYPQAFTHLALINAVMHLINAQHQTTHATPLAPRTGAGPEEEAGAGNDHAATGSARRTGSEADQLAAQPRQCVARDLQARPRCPVRAS